VSGKLKITTRESAIRAILREALATTPGVTERGKDDKQVQTTVPTQLPINPSDQMATQLQSQRPPVEDPEFIPANQEELGRSLSVLASLIPDSQVGKFYRQFVALVDKSNEEETETETGG